MTDISESCGWWECSMEAFAEWTFEGGLKDFVSVGAVGNRTRYQSGMYDGTWKERTFCQFEWHRDNKDLLPSQALA